MSECFVCSDEITNEHADGGRCASHDAVTIRDGSRGHYLGATFVLDVDGLVPDKVPADILDLAAKDLATMGPSDAPSLTAGESETLADYAYYDAEGILFDAGYITVWEDGFVIYTVEGDSDE